MSASSKPHPRTKPPEERRAELMHAAERLFLRNGIAATTIEQITTTAHVAKGTFYLYFSSKDDVLAALRVHFAQDLLQTIKNAVDGQKSWPDKLSAWASAGVSGYIDAIRLHDILFYASSPPTREGLVDNIIIDHLIGILQNGVKAKAWSVDDARSTAVFLFSGLHGIVDDAYRSSKRVQREPLARRLQVLCLRTVGLSGD